MIDIGKLGVSKIYIGKTEISKVYVGSVQVFPSGSPTGSDVEITIDIAKGNTTFNLALIMQGNTADSSITAGEVPVYDFRIDWNDGSATERYSNTNWSDCKHTYTTAGSYVVKINGSFDYLGSNTYEDNSSATTELRRITELKLIDGVKYLHLGSHSNSSNYGSNTITKVSGSLLASDCENFIYAFCYCSNLTDIDADLFKECSEVTSFDSVFYGCSSLTSIPENLFVNNTAVTTFRRTFYNCTSLTSIPESLFANNTAVTTFNITFYNCTLLTSIPENLFANNTAVTTFYGTFQSCTSLTSVPKSLFTKNTAVTDFSYTFRNCTSLTSIPSGLFAYNTKVTDFSYTFYCCWYLISIPESLFANNTATTTFEYTFSYCNSLKSIPSGLFDNNTKVTNFYGTFACCSSLTSIPENLFANNTAVTNFNSTFASCSLLTSIPENLFANNTAVTSFRGTFANCTSLTSIPHDWCCHSAKITNMHEAHSSNTVARQIAINAYKISSSSNSQLCSSGESLAYLERVFVWNITSTTLGYLNSNYNYYPTTTVSGGGTLFIGRTETDEGWYDDSLLEGSTIADSTFVAQMLTKGYNKVYVGTCKLGEYKFNSNGYIEKAGTYTRKSETITIPTVEEILASVNS